MSKASVLAADLVTRQVPSDEKRRRREAANPPARLAGDLHGRMVALASTPTQAPHIIEQAEEQTLD